MAVHDTRLPITPRTESLMPRRSEQLPLSFWRPNGSVYPYNLSRNLIGEKIPPTNPEKARISIAEAYFFLLTPDYIWGSKRTETVKTRDSDRGNKRLPAERNATLLGNFLLKSTL